MRTTRNIPALERALLAMLTESSRAMPIATIYKKIQPAISTTRTAVADGLAALEQRGVVVAIPQPDGASLYQLRDRPPPIDASGSLRTVATPTPLSDVRALIGGLRAAADTLEAADQATERVTELERDLTAMLSLAEQAERDRDAYRLQCERLEHDLRTERQRAESSAAHAGDLTRELEATRSNLRAVRARLEKIEAVLTQEERADDPGAGRVRGGQPERANTRRIPPP